MDAPEEVVLDVNEMAKGRSSCRWGIHVSDDGNLLGIRRTTRLPAIYAGGEDLRSGKMLPDHTERVARWFGPMTTRRSSIASKMTHQAAISGVPPPPRGPADPQLATKRKMKNSMCTRETRSKAYLLLFSASHTTSEVRYIPAGEPGRVEGDAAAQAGREYYPDHNGNFFISGSTTRAEFRLVKAPVADPRSQNWQESFRIARMSCWTTRTSSRTTTY